MDMSKAENKRAEFHIDALTGRDWWLYHLAPRSWFVSRVGKKMLEQMPVEEGTELFFVLPNGLKYKVNRDGSAESR